MFYYSNYPPQAGKPCRIVERDKDGKPRGEYNGYWDPKHGIIRLYPSSGSCGIGNLIVDTDFRSKKIRPTVRTIGLFVLMIVFICLTFK